MCGIIGYVGNRNAKKYLYYGLKSLEYRGYDSAGISVFQNKKIETIKGVGSVDEVFQKIHNIKSNIGIGHTRWATHGKVSTENSHPHQSKTGIFSLVHNGIIENYNELKEKYLKGVKLKSQTDTEVVANLLEVFCKKTKDINLAIKKIIKLLKGSFALAILCQDLPDKIFFAKRKSPLFIGIDKDKTFLSSDILGFEKFAQNYIAIDDDEFGFIENNNFEIFDKNNKKIAKLSKKITKNVQNNTKLHFKHYMLKEIFETTQVVENTINLYCKKEFLDTLNIAIFENF